MPDQPLPERLRDLAHDTDSPLGPVARAALTGAADELERLAGVKASPFLWDRLRELAGAIEQGPQPNGDDDEADAGALRAAASRLEMLERAAERDAPVEHLRGYAELVREGVPAPTVETRRFAARFPGGEWGQPPAPGSFVFCGPALAVWRVLGVEPLELDTRGTHALELEPVDAHDVPMLSRVAEVPLPVSELVAEPDRGPVDAALADPERSLALCSATWLPAAEPGAPELPECVCVRVHGHDGEHLFRWDGGELPVDFRHDGPPRVVDRGSPEAQDALWREGQGGAPFGSGGVPIADGGPWERSE